MPSCGGYGNGNHGKYYRYWEKHYKAKGCGPGKISEMIYRRKRNGTLFNIKD